MAYPTSAQYRLEFDLGPKMKLESHAVVSEAWGGVAWEVDTLFVAVEVMRGGGRRPTKSHTILLLGWARASGCPVAYDFIFIL
jgi:hypothetical protein